MTLNKGGWESRLEREAAFVDSLFEAPVGIAFFDRDLRYLRINRALAEIDGVPADAHIGRTVSEVLPAVDPQMVSSLERVLATGQPIVGQETACETPAAPGERRTWLVSYFPAKRLDGTAVGLDALVVDITDRKRAEEAADAANRSKDDFLATLSHELRTPLNAILGWAQLARNGRLGEQEMRHALDTIERNARVQSQLVEDILDVSRIIAGKLHLHPQRVDVAPFVLAAVEALKPAAEFKRIELDVRIADDVDTIRGDIARLQQIVWNLLSNAIKFTPTGGRVGLHVVRKGGDIALSVVDTGKGIRPEFLPLVFDRYRQADGAITRAHGGLGLGLAIVRHLVELHGGSVRADSEGDGKGATFVVSLPADAVAPDPWEGDEFGPDTAAEAMPRLERLRVLVVDDEPDARELLTVILEQQGAQVAAVGDSPQAVRAFIDWHPNLLVSDIGLPGEDGYALVGRIRALAKEAGRSIPAVALTAYAGEEHIRRALMAGFDMHVPKPVEPDAFLSVISRISGWVR